MSFFRTISLSLLAAFAFGSAAAADIRMPEYQTVMLDNGATLLLMPRKDVPLVAANIAVRGGALADVEEDERERDEADEQRGGQHAHLQRRAPPPHRGPRASQPARPHQPPHAGQPRAGPARCARRHDVVAPAL